VLRVRVPALLTPLTLTLQAGGGCVRDDNAYVGMVLKSDLSSKLSRPSSCNGLYIKHYFTKRSIALHFRSAQTGPITLCCSSAFAASACGQQCPCPGLLLLLGWPYRVGHGWWRRKGRNCGFYR